MTDDMERYYYWKDGTWEQISDESTTNNFYTLEQCANELNRLNKENEQLRKEKECDKQIFTKKRLHELLQQTQKENEHIKQTIHEAYETERTQIGKNVLRQLQEAIK